MQNKRLSNPWWIPPFLGRVPEGIDQRSIGVLAVVSLALAFEEYDLALLTTALKQISADLNMATEDFGLYLAIIRLGALPAFLFIPLADRIGRRPVFIFSTTAGGLLTFGTAFVQTPEQFVLMQVLTRTFFLAGSAIAIVIVTEEFPAAHRGWGIGMMAALSSVGHGASAAAYTQIDIIPYGWRALYVVGVVPVLLLPVFLRMVPETQRFSQSSQPSNQLISFRTMLQPMKELARQHPKRALSVAGSGLLFSLGTLPTFQLSGYYTLTQLEWTPGMYGSMVLLAGAVGVVGNIVAGRLGDTLGRKTVGYIFLTGFPVFSFGFYHGDSWLVVLSWTGLVFCMMGARVILRALSTELFPTAQRSSASGLFAVLETIGAAIGLIVVWLYGAQNANDIGVIVPLISLAALFAALILMSFPETGRRELEDIS